MKYTFDVADRLAPLTASIIVEHNLKVKSITSFNGMTTIVVNIAEQESYDNLRDSLVEQSIPVIALEWHKCCSTIVRVTLNPESKVPKLFSSAIKQDDTYTFETNDLGFCWNVYRAINSTGASYKIIEELSH